MVDILTDDALYETLRRVHLCDAPSSTCVCKAWRDLLCSDDPWFMGSTPELRRCRARAASHMRTRRARRLLPSLFGGRSSVINYDDPPSPVLKKLLAKKPTKAPVVTEATLMTACTISRVARLEQLRAPSPVSAEGRLLRRLALLLDEFERVEARYVDGMVRLLELSDGLPASARRRRQIASNTRSLVAIHRDVLLPGIRFTLLPLGLSGIRALEARLRASEARRRPVT